MCMNPFKAPKIKAKDPVAPAPLPKIDDTQLAPEIKASTSEREGVQARKKGRAALRIDLDGSVPGGTGLHIPRA